MNRIGLVFATQNTLSGMEIHATDVDEAHVPIPGMKIRVAEITGTVAEAAWRQRMLVIRIKERPGCVLPVQTEIFEADEQTAA